EHGLPLVLVVVVEGGAGDPGAGDDRADRQPPVAALGHHPGDGGDYAIALVVPNRLRRKVVAPTRQQARRRRRAGDSTGLWLLGDHWNFDALGPGAGGTGLTGDRLRVRMAPLGKRRPDRNTLILW